MMALLLAGFIAYLGFRTLAHEALLRHYQQQTLAQSHTAQVRAFILELLNNKAVRLSSIANYLKNDDLTLNTFIAKDSDVDAIFILQKNQLLFPDELAPLDEREKAWVQSITPIIHDPSLLYNHYFTDEKSQPASGWFISNESSDPLLIFWLNQNDLIIGFKVSYVGLLSDAINQLAFDYSPDTLTVEDNGRLLYQSGNPQLIRDSLRLDTQRLPYPLSRWQIDYYGYKTDSYALYLGGGLLIALLILAVGLMIFRFYREYTRTVRLASQQVSFVGQVSHELKTPLTNITLYAEMLKEEPFDEDSPAPRYLDVITSESQRLSRLIQNILSFTKAPKVHLQQVDLNSLLEQIYQTFIPAFTSKGMTLELQNGCPIVVCTDIDRLTQIISNFLSNAEKYASQGKRVDLIAQCDDQSVYIRVRDYGSGIASKELKSIFQPFYRIKSTITEGVSGTGIGLTIAQQLAQGLQGEILVENMSPGIQFSVKLPLTV